MLNIVVTCTKRKSVAPADGLSLRDANGRNAKAIVKEWIRRLQCPRPDKVIAKDLYQGDHWQVANSLLKADVTKSTVKLWVCSAGYGLIPVSVPIAPYSATFSKNHPDSVIDRLGDSLEVLRFWWESLAEWGGPVADSPRTLTEIASRDRGSRILVAASDQYLQAMRSDLEGARSSLGDARQLVIFSGSGNLSGELSSNLVSCDARMQKLLGGSLMSLNIRTLRWAIAGSEGSQVTPESVREKLSKCVQQQPVIQRNSRTTLSDDQIKSFIIDNQHLERRASATTMLQTLRLRGYACEQKRFKALFSESMEALHG